MTVIPQYSTKQLSVYDAESLQQNGQMHIAPYLLYVVGGGGCGSCGTCGGGEGGGNK